MKEISPKMKYKLKLYGLYLPFFIIAALAAIALRTVALFIHFAPTDAFYDAIYYNNTLLVDISYYIIFASVIFFISYIFTAKRGVKLIPSFTSAATYVPTGVLGVGLLFMAIHLFKTASAISSYKITSIYEPQEYPTKLLVFVCVASAIFAILGIVHIFLTALVESHSSTKRAAFGLCTVLFLSIYTIYLYFSSEMPPITTVLPINAPNKIADQMAYLTAALFFLYEIRLSIGREKWRQYVAIGFIAAMVTAYSSIPALIYYIAEGKIISNSIFETALTFTLFLFIISRLLLAGYLIEDKESASVSVLLAGADERERELHPTPEATADAEDTESECEATEDIPDQNQISIDELGEEPSEHSEEAVQVPSTEETEIEQ